MKKKEANLQSVCLVLAAGICWGIIGLFSRPLASAGISPAGITILRCLTVSLCLFLYLLVRNPGLLRIRLRDMWMFAGTGLCSIVFFNICYFQTISRASLSFAAVLLYTAPFFVIILSALLFHEKISPVKTAALFAAFAGCVLVTGLWDGKPDYTAVLTGAGSGLGYALYSIFGNIALRKYSTETVTFYTFLTASAGLLPFTDPSGMTDVFLLHRNLLLTTAALGIFSTMIPFLLYTKGLRQLEPGQAAILAFSEPMTATAAGIIFFGETLTPASLTGILMIFGGLVLISLKDIKKHS